ncbi:uncharacterized protein KY384_003071 [Bacidia gigantensis]|uniref:uncharacterized protein n=1 Tax=Bacidia gigantensis TaxID=2732470 RepID=UPI001D04006B|nr:uncharacterized protein KY384_003071 [Bacidia gigantensis]KAG8531442.1 hypothetical protein KY384_003071 [Bacidia gigantensis]
MGVLVGTALIVIVPEGVETLYSASDYSAQTHTKRFDAERPQLLRARALADVYDEEAVRPLLSWNTRRDDKPDVGDLNAMPGLVIPPGVEAETESDPSHSPPPKTPTEPGVVGILGGDDNLSKPSDLAPPKSQKKEPADSLTPPSKSTPEREPHAWIGLSLILGFILMYLLDTLPLFDPKPAARPHSNIYSLSDLSSSPVSTPAPPLRSLSTTLGLCIHAAADGIALGASSSSASTSSLSLIIFVAIMVHKAPAAFGLTSVLLKQGLGKRGARAHLVVFSLAAPAGALATWILVKVLSGGWESEPAVMKWWTGAGSARQQRKGKESKSPKLVLAAVGGMLLPLITQIGHAH